MPTSMPSTALTTTTARSATPSAGIDLADEVGVARRVEEVDLVGLAVGGLPLERGEPSDSDMSAFDLLGLGVAHRRAVFDPSDASRDTRSMQQRFGERGLAAATVADEHHVADALCWDDLHHLTPMFELNGVRTLSIAEEAARRLVHERTNRGYGWRVE